MMKSANKRQRGSPWLKDVYEAFAPVRKEILEKGITEDEVNDVIDKAVKAVRKKHAKSRL